MTAGGAARAVTAGLFAASLLFACTAPVPGSLPGDTQTNRAKRPTPGAPGVAVTTTPNQPVTVLPTDTGAQAALSTSQALFGRASVAVVLPEQAGAGQLHAAAAGVALGAPVLVATPADPAPLVGELQRLEVETVLAVGSPEPAVPNGVDVITAPTDPRALADLIRRELPPHQPTADPATAAAAVAQLDRARPDTRRSAAWDDGARLPATRPGKALDDVLLLSTGAAQDVAAVATARAAGAAVQIVPNGDPRTSGDAIDQMSRTQPRHVLALGAAFGDAARLQARLAVVRTGVELPGGGQTLFPGRRMVALYGHPGTPALGVLGEQPVEQAIERARQVAAQYQASSDRPVVPTFEIIATIASSKPGPDGNYSAEADIATLQPWVDAARAAGVYVVLDLQPGTTDFLTQARIYEPLLTQPNVGLALDPEWRLRPGQRHLRQVGSVGVDEVNQVSDWLATLTREHALPQKLLVLHQFRTSMIAGREGLVTTHDELAVLVHADGNGTPAQKLATWDAVRAGAPEGVWWGWKNFYDEDSPTLTPEQTYALQPVPDLVSYQ